MRPKLAGFVAVCDHGGTQHFCFSVYANGSIEMPFQYMVSRAPFAAEADRLALLERLNAIPGIAIAKDAIARRPSFPIEVLTDDARLGQFTDVVRDYLASVRS